MPLGSDEEFDRELVDLFVQEAHEWLQQIHVALDELQQSPPPDRHSRLVGIIKAGITNLGGSAATIQLHDVEHASFSAIPLVEAVQDPRQELSANAFLELCRHLGRIHSALTSATGVSFDEEAGASSPHSSAKTIASVDLLAALQRMSAHQTVAGPAGRNLVQAVIAQVEGLMKNGVVQCEITAFRDFLARVEEEENAFLRAVREQVPVLVEELERVKISCQAAVRATREWPALVERVAQLSAGSQQLNASAVTMFFRGLHSFLAILSQGSLTVPVQRFDAVEVRLLGVVDALQAWVNAGREERAAIGAVLLNQG